MKSMSADLGPCLKPVLSMAQPWELSRNTNGPSSIVFFSLQIVIRNLFQRLTFNFPFYVTSQETTQTIDFSVKISPFPVPVYVPDSFCAQSSITMVKSHHN